MAVNVTQADWWAPGGRCPGCGRRHVTWTAVAKCRWRPEWVAGSVPCHHAAYAVVSFCRRPGYPGSQITVTLWGDIARAEQALADLNQTGCGGACRLQHELVAIHPA